MSNRTTGIGHIAARSLLAEIALLREDIHQQGVILQSIDAAMTALYCELHHSLRGAQRIPRYLARSED